MYKSDMRFSLGALEAIRKGEKKVIVGLFEDTNLWAIHGKQVTILL